MPTARITLSAFSVCALSFPSAPLAETSAVATPPATFRDFALAEVMN